MLDLACEQKYVLYRTQEEEGGYQGKQSSRVHT